MRVFLTSDIHIDYPVNFEVIRNLKVEDSSVLVVAGDVTNDLEKLIECFKTLLERYTLVMFTPGNHDVWKDSLYTTNKEKRSENSLEKLERVLKSLRDIGVICDPVSVTIGNEDTFLFAPLFSWYHSSFDQEPDIPAEKLPGGKLLPVAGSLSNDSKRTEWPLAEIQLEWLHQKSPLNNSELYDTLNSLCGIKGEKRDDDWKSQLIAWKLDSMNDNCHGATHTYIDSIAKNLKEKTQGAWRLKHEGNTLLHLWRNPERRNDLIGHFKKIFSFSHFIPFPSLSPEKRYLLYPNLSKLIGSKVRLSNLLFHKFLGCRLLTLLPDYHFFGHTHFGWYGKMRSMRSVGRSEWQSTNTQIERILNCTFVQCPLAYPRERQVRFRSLVIIDRKEDSYPNDISFQIPCLFTTDASSTEEQLYKGWWSDHYETHERDSSNTDLAPWVHEVLTKYLNI